MTLVLGRYTKIPNRYPIFWNTDTDTNVCIYNTEKYRISTIKYRKYRKSVRYLSPGIENFITERVHIICKLNLYTGRNCRFLCKVWTDRHIHYILTVTLPDVSTTGNDSEKVASVALHLQQLTTPAVRRRFVWLTRWQQLLSDTKFKHEAVLIFVFIL